MQESASFPSVISDHDIHITPAAQEKLAELLAQAEDAAGAIRIFVSGGGCGGMTYGMTYAEEGGTHDAIREGNKFRIVVDAIALNYLQGCEIDYQGEGPGASFVFSNVFQSVGGSSTCGGCGSAGGGRF